MPRDEDASPAGSARYDSRVTSLDFAPLTSPVTRAELEAFRRERGAAPSAAIMIVIAAFALVGVAMLVGVIASGLASRASANSSGSIVFALFVAVAIAAVIALRWLAARATWTRWLRLSRFARANGLVFVANAPVPAYPGAIFGVGNARVVPEQLYRQGERYLDIGNLRYTTGSGKNRTTHNWGYVAMKLDRMLPHMILDAKANNFLGTNLPVSFSRSQVLSLEGDFDRHFTLYCPREYERDALYVFTPDLMARLIDEAGLFDVEIIDDWMFLYSARTFDLSDPRALSRVFRIIDTVGEKTLDRTELYADAKVVSGAVAAASGAPLGARMAANIVAPQGRRLRRGLSVGTIVVLIGVAIYAVVSVLPFFRAF